MKLIKELLAGIFIGIGGTIFLAIENKIIGALFFSFALLSVLNFKVILYTGRIGYFFDYSGKEKLSLLHVLLLNCLGTFIVALIVFLMGNNTINERILTVDIGKFTLEWYQVLFRSIMCGIMMVIAVEGFKRFDNFLMKNLIVILSIAIFVISGFEHSIANMYYYFLGLLNGFTFYFKDVLLLLLTVLGNRIGSIGLYLLLKLGDKTKEEKAENLEEK